MINRIYFIVPNTLFVKSGHFSNKGILGVQIGTVPLYMYVLYIHIHVHVHLHVSSSPGSSLHVCIECE